MQRVFQDNVLAKEILDKALGVKMADPFVGIIIEDRNARVVASLIFNNFDFINIDLTISAFGPISPVAIRDVARYVFVRLGCKRVTCLTLSSNRKAINSLSRLGFECEGLLKERFPQGDAFIFGLLASRQKFLRLERGQHSQPA